MQQMLGAFIEGTTPVYDLFDLNWGAWERCNHLIHSWFINFVSESIAQTIGFHENVVVLEDLKERFSKVVRIISQILNLCGRS